MPIVVALALLQFTGPTGGRVDINADEISTIRDSTKIGEGGHYGPGTHCVLVLTNGHAVPVQEDCDRVRELVRGRTGPCTLVCGETPPR